MDGANNLELNHQKAVSFQLTLTTLLHDRELLLFSNANLEVLGFFRIGNAKQKLIVSLQRCCWQTEIIKKTLVLREMAIRNDTKVFNEPFFG